VVVKYHIAVACTKYVLEACRLNKTAVGNSTEPPTPTGKSTPSNPGGFENGEGIAISSLAFE